ncbi:MAG TPA: EAL domain-containing protein [Gaiellaceae bacterium]|nr:EAL domain-containing protein [Gaiellaceae bacterium]
MAEALATSDVLQRVAGTVAIHLYEMEMQPNGDYVCNTFIGAGLESLLGPLPADRTPEQAWEDAVHEDDRAGYDASYESIERGEPFEIEYRLVGYDGRTRWVWDRMHPRRTDDGRLLVDGIVVDITDRKHATEELAEAQRQLRHIAYHDPLTGLPNRIAFEERLEQTLAPAPAGQAVAVLFVDLDDFKLVNDSFGHTAGDELLRAVAERLRRATRAEEVVARHGGDEFLLLVSAHAKDGEEPDVAGARYAAEAVARRIRRALRAPFEISGVEIVVSASVGISLYPLDAENAQTLLKHADAAMYRAKDEGRDRYQVYAVDGDNALAQLSMAGRLRGALDREDGLVLHFQPLVRLDSAEMVGVEALIRWHDGDRLVPPGDFLPLAERMGLMGRLSDWVVAEACRQATRWRDGGLDLYVSVNLPPSFWQPTAMRHVLATIETFGLNPDRLMIEITESAFAVDARRNMEFVLAELHERGLRLAIDDFGSGHSSLSRLNQMRVSMLKIDRSFVGGVEDDAGTAVLTSSIVQLARNLGLEPLAEGIETEEQRRFLLAHGCELGQGFHFSRPVPAGEIEALYRASRDDGLAAQPAA